MVNLTYEVREGGKIEMVASETPCSMNEVEPCDCSRKWPEMKTRQRSGTPGDKDERRDGYCINNDYHML